MKYLATLIVLFVTLFSFSQDEEKAQLQALKKANDYVYEGNNLVNEDDYVSAEMEYRKAISENPNSIAGAYNLGNAYYTKGSFDEAVYRLQEAAKKATSKSEKHKAFHNIGTILMKGKKCKEAVEAFKSALRNNPADDETRYNLGLAKECAKEQQDKEDQNKDDKKDKNEDQKDNKDKKDDKENKDNKDKEGDNKEDKKDEGDKEKKEGDDKKDDEGKPKDEKEDQGKDGDKDKKEQQQPKPQPGQMSAQQMKNLLEAMNNQEQKVQEKMNAEKAQGVKVKAEKDW
ncbi:tetratricopeptide repeat protein [Algibacter sp. L4_22]|uniref:tetratricopeptide repeat protein n=1 Tax=Algibacter sp. L4_22 TaxID=2942477 RepID=UPI00201B93E4|nr:tetratricopeptide repeat protein [Algibacter sp. L4_22]MCL5127048.1 aerotolerance regulator BatC [Algibacter sp. L4_22]